MPTMVTSRRALSYCIALGTSIAQTATIHRPSASCSTSPAPAPARPSVAEARPQVLNRSQLSSLSLEEAINAELLPMKEAQHLKVHKFPQFFSQEDIQLVLDFKRTQGQALGTVRRGSTGLKALDSPWVTTYLSTDNLLEKCHPALVQRLVEAAVRADEAQGWGLLAAPPGSPLEGRLNVRVMELHSVMPGGALSDKNHFDGGSLVTLDVMLSSPGDFDGGSFSTPESDGNVTRHDFSCGDLIVFPSHKYHFVEPVTAGYRAVMVMELWRGESRGCAHRCLQHLGDCDYSTARSKVDTLLHASFPEVDPW
mmetsp:Transcript_26176/g.49121  ORF Transcript_26176/g.49121 Transcript_26176/m.49121 type:complete len:310 (-) Transcript_26176:103-1032(-)